MLVGVAMSKNRTLFVSFVVVTFVIQDIGTLVSFLVFFPHSTFFCTFASLSSMQFCLIYFSMIGLIDCKLVIHYGGLFSHLLVIFYSLSLSCYPFFYFI